jgi:peptide/nickel transport system ATP-binding protein
VHGIDSCRSPAEPAPTDVGTWSACRRAADLASGQIRWVSAAARPPVAAAAAPGEGAGRAADLVTLVSLDKTFHVKRGLFGATRQVHALRDVSLTIAACETVGVVGESGCGKTTLGRLLLRLDQPSGGQVLFRGQDITRLGDRALRPFRRHTQVIFQDPYSSLNPRQRIGSILTEPMRVHGIVANAAQADAEARRLLMEVGLLPENAERYPHQLSGGQRQRVAIARALAMRPELIVCDEAVSALDVSVQAQVINLLADLQRSHRLSYLFIGHDLAVVRQIATRVVVMYLGRIVEIAERDSFYREPLHPYSRLLMSAVPTLAEAGCGGHRRAPAPPGEPPSPLAPPSGCAFRTRCPLAGADCAERVPELRSLGPGRQVACLRIA